jgi:hypothetical protein
MTAFETTIRPEHVLPWLQLIRAEYNEIPGLHLTRDQVRRLWALDDLMCDVVLSALVEGSFLRRTQTGQYVRSDSGGR